MVESYDCPRCGHEFTTRASLVRHLKRQNTCQALLDTISAVEILKIVEKPKLTDGFQCEFCDKFFNSSQGKYQHKKFCKKKKKNDDISSRIEELTKEINDLKKKSSKDKSSSTTTNSQNINCNNTYNIQINNLKPFGSENMEPLDIQTIGDLFLNLDIPELLKILHCNPDYPENHNIRIKSVKRKAIEIYRGNKWDIVTYVNGLSEYLKQGRTIFFEYYKNNKNTVKDEMTSEELEDILKTLREIDSIEKEVFNKVLKRYYSDLALMLESIRTIKKSGEELRLTNEVIDTDNEEEDESDTGDAGDASDGEEEEDTKLI